MKKIRTFVFLPHVTWMLSSWESFASLYVFVATWVSLCFSEEPQVGWLTSLEMRVEKNKVQFYLNLLSHFMLGRHFTTFLWVIFTLLTSCAHLIFRNQAKADTCRPSTLGWVWTIIWLRYCSKKDKDLVYHFTMLTSHYKPSGLNFP